MKDITRREVIGIGALAGMLSPDWARVAKAADSFFDLPELHPMDEQEVAHAIHVIQQKLLGRPAYRRYKELPR